MSTLGWWEGIINMSAHMDLDDNLILEGYVHVGQGKVQVGDRCWDAKLLAWLPITVNDGRDVRDFPAVIRKANR